VRFKAAITVGRSPDEVRSLWGSADHEHLESAGATVRFETAPGDRGTEVHVALGDDGRLGRLTGAIRGASGLAKTKDHLRRFKQQVETGEIPRSDGAPEGERAERKLKQRPAQPLEDAELTKAGA
jgi:uncharacterized membrane protein